jgi:hypothetical protein
LITLITPFALLFSLLLSFLDSKSSHVLWVASHSGVSFRFSDFQIVFFFFLSLLRFLLFLGGIRGHGAMVDFGFWLLLIITSDFGLYFGYLWFPILIS